jgi:hypothetical protein
LAVPGRVRFRLDAARHAVAMQAVCRWNAQQQRVSGFFCVQAARGSCAHDSIQQKDSTKTMKYSSRIREYFRNMEYANENEFTI